MKSVRYLAVGGFLAMVGAVLVTSRTEAQPNSLTPIGPGVWFREGDIDKEGHCNNIIIEMKDYLIVVDANFPSGARLAMADAKRVSKKPVKYVFDTHHHGDHAYGNSVWTAAGATTLAYKGVAEEMKRYEPKRWQETNRADVKDLKQASVEPPKETFDKTPYVLDDGTRRVEFHFFGWAHTRGDGFVYLPKEQILATGDAVVNGAYNYMDDGHVGNWPKVVEKALKLKVKTVLPAHGRSGGTEILKGQGAFMREIYAGVQGLMKAGKTADDIQKMGMDKSLEAALHFSPISKNWVGKGLAGQAVATFEELKQKKPRGEISGGK